jgi:hypothetical protein
MNAKVPFEFDATQPGPWSTPTFLTLLGDRLIVKYFNRLYIFGLKTKVWTRWDTGSRYIGPAVAFPIRGEVNAIPEYIIPTAVSIENKVFGFRDIIDATNAETINCSIKTKNYDYGVPHRYKRLMWWGANIATISDVTGTLQPIIIGFSVTWDGLETHTWDELEDNTWDQPLSMPVVIQNVVPAQFSLRKFVKFPKPIRFRQINYKVEFSYDGTNITGPVRFFDLTTIIGTKEHVSKALT